MANTKFVSTLVLICTMTLAGCATPVVEPEQTGFISDYSKLEKVGDKQWFYSAGKSSRYQKFHIEPVHVLFTDDSDDPMFKASDIEELKQYIHTELTKRLSKDDGYTVVPNGGPGVASFRIAITDLDSSNGLLNATIYTKVTGAGLGGIAIEGELIDSQSKEQLAATIRWGSGSRVLRAGFTHLGDAKILISRWAKDTRKAIDAANAK